MFSLLSLVILTIQSAFLMTTEQCAGIFIEDFWVVVVSSLFVQMLGFFPMCVILHLYMSISFGFFYQSVAQGSCAIHASHLVLCILEYNH